MEILEKPKPLKAHAPPLIRLIKYLFLRQISGFFTIFGRRGSGKTDFALLQLEILHHYKVMKHFATNIEVKNPPFHIEHINNLDALRAWAYDNKGPKIFVFDEVGMATRRRSPMTALNIKVIDDFQILRKPKLSFLALTINPQYVDNALLGTHILDGSWIKPNWKNPGVAQYHDLIEDIDKRFYHVPPTSILFNTFGTARFTEHGPTLKPKIKDEDESKIWDWANGATSKDIGWHSMQLHRKLKIWAREQLKAKYHVAQ